jgi:hypothetical protein
VVVQIFLAQSQTVNPLREHLGDRVLAQLLVAAVAETGRQPSQKAIRRSTSRSSSAPPSLDT